MLFRQTFWFVFAAFLFSQFLAFNADGATNAGSTFCVLSKFKKEYRSSVTDKARPAHRRKSGMHLNKRFQPEQWVYLPAVQYRAPHCISVFRKPLFYYRNGFVPSFLFIAQTLRGPPVGA